jgi:alpha-L-fucosidase 2
MKFHPWFLLALAAGSGWAEGAPEAGNPSPAANDVTWTTPGTNENDSMPLGNGDLAANGWTEQNGDLVLLLAKADAWTETGQLVKLGRVRIHWTPSPLAGAANFTQKLRLEDGSMEVKSGENTVRVWIDANNPVLHVETTLAQAGNFEAKLEVWRKTQAPEAAGQGDYAPVMAGNISPHAEPDVLFPAGANRVTWCHFNPDSYYPYVMRQEHLESLLEKYPDPLLHRCFGAMMTGPGLSSSDDYTLKSTAAGRSFRLDVVALSQRVDTPKIWREGVDALGEKVSAQDLAQAWQAHAQWWRDFWNRSWITVGGTESAARVSQGYAMQRYMMGCSSRGESPVKFNGGLFTVGHDLPAGVKQTEAAHDPDYRQWGESYWNQNNRLLYWPLLATGDDDLLVPWFAMYLKALPLAKDRTQLYHHHDGASLPETMQFWGLPRLEDFGKNNPTDEIESHWQQYHIQGTLEVIAQMLDYNDYHPDAEFVRTQLVPFADAIVTYYDQHWPRDAKGKIKLAPTQSLETYQLDAVNPTPDIAGLMDVLPRLLALPTNATTAAQRAAWAKTLTDLPPIPMGKTANRKTPPLGVGDVDGTPVILPAEQYGKTNNSENPELYVAFPYRLYGVGKPNLQLALDTFAARRFPQDTCWGQDGTQAAVLGLTAMAQKATVAEFSNYGAQRFSWFWKPAHDWIPDLDNGGDGMITLQLMLMQCDGKRILLLPAWPSDWTADFKLHAPYNTTVEGRVEGGKVTQLKVTPAARVADVVMAVVEK